MEPPSPDDGPERRFGPKPEGGGRSGAAGGPRLPPPSGPLPLGPRRPSGAAMAAAGLAILLGVFGGVALLEWGPGAGPGLEPLQGQQGGGLASTGLTSPLPTVTVPSLPSLPPPTAPWTPSWGSSSSTLPSPSPDDSEGFSPSISPSISPSVSPSVSPSASPSVSPSASPSVSPSASPSISPSVSPSISPSVSPTSSSSSGGITIPLLPLH